MNLMESHAEEATFSQLEKSGYHVSQGGDFRSAECVEILKAFDIVVTITPFSLFSEYAAQLLEHRKQYLIIGSKNAITYKEVFKLIEENKLWLGVGFNAGNAYFEIPTENLRDFAAGGYYQKSDDEGMT